MLDKKQRFTTSCSIAIAGSGESFNSDLLMPHVPTPKRRQIKKWQTEQNSLNEQDTVGDGRLSPPDEFGRNSVVFDSGLFPALYEKHDVIHKTGNYVELPSEEDRATVTDNMYRKMCV